MSFATGLINTANKLLTKFNVTDRTVYKRTFTRTGGDALIGRPGTVTHVDVALDPPPLVQVVNSHMLSFGVVPSGLAQIGDYYMTISSSALTRTDFQNKDVALVFKLGSSEEELFILTFNPLVANGIDVVFEVLARSKKR